MPVFTPIHCDGWYRSGLNQADEFTGVFEEAVTVGNDQASVRHRGKDPERIAPAERECKEEKRDQSAAAVRLSLLRRATANG